MSSREGPKASVVLSYEMASAMFAYEPHTGRIIRLQQRNRYRAFTEAGHIHHSGYRVIEFNDRSYMAHRLAWLLMTGEWPSEEIDHVNRDRSDNRWGNLRAATPSQNCGNKSVAVNNTSGIRGVYWCRQKGAWRARMRAAKKHIHVGFFDCKLDAAIAVRAAYEREFGQFYPGQEVTDAE